MAVFCCPSAFLALAVEQKERKEPVKIAIFDMPCRAFCPNNHLAFLPK
jgi:hypothetical protein